MADTIVHDPENKKAADEIFVFLSEDKQGRQGICGAPINGAKSIPMVCMDEAMLNVLKPVAKELAKLTDKKIKLTKFFVKEELEVYE